MITTCFYAVLTVYVASLLTFILYAWDKHQAHYCKFRIPEFLLLFFTVCGGAFGATMAMYMFRHKTSKRLFKVISWVSLLVTSLAVIAWIWYFHK